MLRLLERQGMEKPAGLLEVEGMLDRIARIRGDRWTRAWWARVRPAERAQYGMLAEYLRVVMEPRYIRADKEVLRKMWLSRKMHQNYAGRAAEAEHARRKADEARLVQEAAKRGERGIQAVFAGLE